MKSFQSSFLNIVNPGLLYLRERKDESRDTRNERNEAITDGTQGKREQIHGILNASSKICSLVVNGQSFLVTDGSLLNLF